jgi:uridylate kinase
MSSDFHRVLLKLSGEIVSGDKPFGFSKSAVNHLRDEISEAQKLDIEIAIVIGGGNVFRGKEAIGDFHIERVDADFLGMLATLYNATLLKNSLKESDISTRVLSAIEISDLAEPFTRDRAIHHLEKGRIVIFACGTGNPYFTTDTAAVLRAIEIGADAILKGTRVKGLYDKDPEKFKNAKFIASTTYRFVMENQLKVMDATAFSLSMDNKIPIYIFNILKKGYLRRVLTGENIGSIVSDR